jgi:hypothetical protein
MNYRSSSEALFHEKQYFRQPWIWLLLLGIAGLSIYSVVQQIIIGLPFGNNPVPDYMVIIIAIVFGVGFPVLFFAVNLEIVVKGDGVYYRFLPFHRSPRKIGFEEISSYEVRTYSALREYGGWGIRYGAAGRALNVSGNRGVQFCLAGGKRILLGSQRADEMATAIRRASDK